MTQLFINGVRIPFHATRFVRAANVSDRRGLSQPAPVDVLTSSHDTPDSPKGQRDHGF